MTHDNVAVSGCAALPRKRTVALAGGAALAAGLLAARKLDQAYLTWGTTAGEREATLPGDAVVTDAALQSTMAVTIAAPPDAVWPWLIQMGQDRGGLYSSLFVENTLLRLRFSNTERIHPEWQNLKVGDHIWFVPEDYPGPRTGPIVLSLDPPQALVLGYQDALTAENHGTWQFVLRPHPNGCRLLLRSRSPRDAAYRVNRWLTPGFFIMQRQMLLGIKRRAEAWMDAPAQPPLIDRFLPDAEFRGQASVAIAAPPAAVMRALRAVTLLEMPVARLLGELRYLPGRLLGRAPARSGAAEPFIDQVLAGGNLILGERPDAELVIGMAGRLHNLADQHPVPFAGPAAFLDFAEPGYQKFVQSFRAEPHPSGGTLLVAEHRTHALSPAARRRFALYWLVIRPTGGLALRMLLEAVRQRAEREAALPAPAVEPGPVAARAEPEAMAVAGD